MRHVLYTVWIQTKYWLILMNILLISNFLTAYFKKYPAWISYAGDFL